MKFKYYILSLLLIAGIHISSATEHFTGKMEKPDCITALNHESKSIKTLSSLLKENNIKEFYKKSNEIYLKLNPESENIESIQESFWLAYYISMASLFPFEDYDKDNYVSLGNTIDLDMTKKIYCEFLKLARNNLNDIITIHAIDRKKLVELFSLYGAHTLYKVRSAYSADLPKREKIAEQNCKTRIAAWRKNATPEQLEKELFGGTCDLIARTYSNKITLNQNRNIHITNDIKMLESYFVPTLVELFPGKKGEVLRYIRMAGYKDNQIDELIDRTVGRDSTTEFLYKGRRKNDAR